MEARFIGPESELGAIHTLDFFGNKLTREWSKVTFTAEALEKAKGNKYVEIRGADARKGRATTAEALEEAQADEASDTMRARLVELGVDVPENASDSKLRSLLDKAEKANAEAEAEAQAAAEKLTGEA